MTPSPRTLRRLATAAVLVVLAGALAHLLLPDDDKKTLSVDFPRTVGLYVGDDVRVLGVPVGEVTSITPERDSVRVELTYRSDVPLSANARAAVLAPTLVTGRYVQLSPIWRTGPQLEDGAEIPIDRTAVPVEWDKIKQNLLRLTENLGPRGANSDGALTRALDTAAANVRGRGANLHDTVRQLSRAMTTLSDGRSDLYGTVRQLQQFIHLLATSDQQVAALNTRLASVSGVLAENSDNLSTTLRTLDAALPVIERFVAENRDQLSTTVQKVERVTSNLAANRQALADILHLAPTAVSNVNNIYDPIGGALTAEIALSNFRDPASFLCSTIFSVGGTPEQCQQALEPLADLAKMDRPPISLNPLQREGRENQVRPDGSPAPETEPGPGPLFGLDDLLVPGGGR